MSAASRYVAEAIKSAREIEELTQEQLAARLGVTQACISYWETERRTPGIDELVAVARATNTRLSWFIPDDEEPCPACEEQRQFILAALSDSVDDELAQQVAAKGRCPEHRGAAGDLLAVASEPGGVS